MDCLDAEDGSTIRYQLIMDTCDPEELELPDEYDVHRYRQQFTFDMATFGMWWLERSTYHRIAEK